ncbi:MAG: hypothetical protein CM15mP77_1100 [Synechococcus sp.]|nr:MAG: hypothetical protein CM15mP77_1100 [Synechococcus sp.]
MLWVKDATGAALEQQLVIQEKKQLGLLLLRMTGRCLLRDGQPRAVRQ